MVPITRARISGRLSAGGIRAIGLIKPGNGWRFLLLWLQAGPFRAKSLLLSQHRPQATRITLGPPIQFSTCCRAELLPLGCRSSLVKAGPTPDAAKKLSLRN